MRVRTVTLSPADEYERRPGQTETIPDALAAMILSRRTRVQVTLKGVTIRDGAEKRTYWHPDSPLCNAIGDGETRRVVAVWSTQDTTKIHLLDDQGRYLETLPEKGKVAWFSQEGAAELAGHRRVISRVYDHLQRLHQGESIDAVECARIAREEAENVQRATMNFEPPASTRAGQRDADLSPTAEAIAEGTNRIAQAEARTAERRREVDAVFDRGGAPGASRVESSRVESPARRAVYDPFDI